MRLYVQAVVIGLLIGLGAVILELWFGNSGWIARILALILLGSAICGFQYWLLRLRKSRKP